VRLLFDEQLSARLCSLLAEPYPGALHVGQIGLGGAPDEAVWTAAAERDCVLVTKDEDFHRLSVTSSGSRASKKPRSWRSASRTRAYQDGASFQPGNGPRSIAQPLAAAGSRTARRLVSERSLASSSAWGSV